MSPGGVLAAQLPHSCLAVVTCLRTGKPSRRSLNRCHLGPLAGSCCFFPTIQTCARTLNGRLREDLASRR
jgi:hypothetical protein